jgi:Flp pilus assembly pilin Flp
LTVPGLEGLAVGGLLSRNRATGAFRSQGRSAERPVFAAAYRGCRARRLKATGGGLKESPIPGVGKEEIAVRKLIRELWKGEDGVTSVEYALMLVLVVVAAIAAWTTLGGNVRTVVTGVNANLVPPAIP